MKIRTRLALPLLTVLIACPAARADDDPPAPLMGGLDAIGIGKPLAAAGLSVSGYVEVGYLYDLTVPGDVTPAKTSPGNDIFFPGVYKNSFILDQFDVAIARSIDASKGKFDVGFVVEGMYGRDAFFTHSNGILDNNNKDGGGPFDQPDLMQAYVQFAIPVGTGLTLEVGKFATLIGYEATNPTSNLLYTLSYQASFANPTSQTGILASYRVDSLTFTAGVSRGWDQTTYDNNGAADFLGQVAWKRDDKFNLIGNISIGPQQPADNAHYSVMLEVVPTYKLSDQWTFAADIMYGLANSYGQWYGLAAYASDKLNNYLTANGRIEYFHDGNDFRVAAPTAAGSDVNYWAATLGLAVSPLPDNSWFNTLTLRPEIRFDMADRGVFDGSKFNEVDFAVDAYWKF
jgi:hypothetical protein